MDVPRHTGVSLNFSDQPILAGSARRWLLACPLGGRLIGRWEMIVSDPAGPVEAQEPRPRDGTIFAGRYRIMGFLGEGDRKHTYLAEDTLLGRKVALALIKPAAATADPVGTGREVKALVQAGNHDNIVTLFDRGNAEKTDYLVFDYLSGGTLRDYLAKRAERGRALSADEVMQLGRQLARALSQVHGHSLVHRDVAPANVWLDERRVAHLGDFDSAVSSRDTSGPVLQPVTTQGYAAPEQVAGGHVDQRSDLYSLGAVLYEALTGERPVPGCQEPARALAALRPGLPRNLVAVIGRLLAESPADRPTDASEVLNELRGGHGPRSGDEALLPWVESLPFPLASIAWHYLAETDPPAKIDYLLKFFEALALFTATIQLSACVSDGKFFDANRQAWFGPGPGGRRVIDLRRATFGAWAELSERLAVTGRRILAGHDSDAAHYLRLFGATDADMVEALTSPELNKILLHARDCRNSWTGHGGVASTQLHKERLHDLEELLARTQDILAWSFETWTLLQPGLMTLSRGTFNLVATVLTGTNPAFRKRQFQIGQPLDSDHLYFLNDGSSTAMKLIPLIRIIAGTESGQDACYFFNRVEGSKVRWVSYHNHSEPEVLAPDEGITQLLTSLIPHAT